MYNAMYNIIMVKSTIPVYTSTTVLCRSVVQWKGLIGSGSRVLNSVRVQIIKAFSLYSDIARCLNFPTPSRIGICKAQ